MEVRRARKRLTKGQLELEQAEHRDKLVNSALADASASSVMTPTSHVGDPGLSSSTSSAGTGVEQATVMTPGHDTSYEFPGSAPVFSSHKSSGSAPVFDPRVLDPVLMDEPGPPGPSSPLPALASRLS